MYQFAENNSYKELRISIIQSIIEESIKGHGDEDIYPLVFDQEYTSRLEVALNDILTEERLEECLSEITMGPEPLIYDLNLKKYWMVMDSKEQQEVLKDDQFYMSKLYQPFITKYKNEDEVETHYDAFHNYFKIPTIIMYERYLREFLDEFLRNNIKIFFRVGKEEQIPVDNPFVLDNKYKMMVQLIKWRIANIIELKWVLLYVNEFTVSLTPIPPGTPSTN